MLNTTKPRMQSQEGSKSNIHRKVDSSPSGESQDDKESSLQEHLVNINIKSNNFIESAFPGQNNSDGKASDKELSAKNNDITAQDKIVTATNKVSSAKN